MTDSDLDAFSVAFKRLGQSMGKSIDSDLLMDAFGDVRDFPLAQVTEALDQLRRTCRYFPRPAQLIQACQEQARARAVEGTAVPAWVDHLQERYLCDQCQDTGFVRHLQCVGDGSCHVVGCGKPDHPATPHDYTRKCSCRATNAWLAQERDKLRRTPEEAR